MANRGFLIRKLYADSNGPSYTSDPRLSGGRISPKAKLYQAPLAEKSSHLFARVRSDFNVWSAPLVLKADD